MENPSDEELVDWGEDEDIIVDEFAEDDIFLEEENNTQVDLDLQTTDVITYQCFSDQPILLREEKKVEEKRTTDANITMISTISTRPKQIKQSGRTKKPS